MSKTHASFCWNNFVDEVNALPFFADHSGYNLKSNRQVWKLNSVHAFLFRLDPFKSDSTLLDLVSSTNDRCLQSIFEGGAGLARRLLSRTIFQAAPRSKGRKTCWIKSLELIDQNILAPHCLIFEDQVMLWGDLKLYAFTVLRIFAIYPTVLRIFAKYPNIRRIKPREVEPFLLEIVVQPLLNVVQQRVALVQPPEHLWLAGGFQGQRVFRSERHDVAPSSVNSDELPSFHRHLLQYILAAEGKNIKRERIERERESERIERESERE